MERNNIQKNITELFNGEFRYIVPLYQRNFAWGDMEITQLLQDLYENYQTNTPYFVGSIVYLNRHDKNYLEVIDGQQRLTVLTLLLNVLGKEFLPELFESKLEYDSRDEVTEYLRNLYKKAEVPPTIESSEVIKTFHAAYSTLKECQLNPEDEQTSIKYLQEYNPSEFIKFVDYITHRVYFVLAEMPQDTDVATYFEIMNNSGDQLQKHEIVKSLLLGLANEKGMSLVEIESLALIWEACSQMDIRIQESIAPAQRSMLFGDHYEGFNPENVNQLSMSPNLLDNNKAESLDSIIINKEYEKDLKSKEIKDDDSDLKGTAIIDFPNFLMHVLKLCYNDIYANTMGEGNDIPLNDKDLLKVFRILKNYIQPDLFVKQLLFYRVVFDRYVIRVDAKDSISKWELAYLRKHSENNGCYVRNTFGKGDYEEIEKANDIVIKGMSLLQVSYPQRKYKNFLNTILSWFSYGKVRYDFNWFMPKLNGLILSTYKHLEEEYGQSLYCLGTKTPRFLLNLIDYLYYRDGHVTDFDFKYYNSVEHHLPQSRENYSKVKREILDSIGNLFLLSRRANSSLNDGDPLTKARKTMQSLDSFPPNRKYIYTHTIDNRGWEAKDIEEHTEQIKELFSRKGELLKFKQLEEGPLLYRACLAVDDYCEYPSGNSKYGEKYNFQDLSGEKGKAALDLILKWQNKNLDKDLKDFISEQLNFNKTLEEHSWRRCFVKYPSIIEFCKNGNFIWNLDGQRIFLLPQNQVVNYARELHCHLFVEKSGLNESQVGIDQYGVWIFLDDTKFKQKYPNADICLHLWVSDDGKKWCYEVWSGRSSNANENKALVKNGWAKNGQGHYYIQGQQYLCNCSSDYETAVDLAIHCYTSLIKRINMID